MNILLLNITNPAISQHQKPRHLTVELLYIQVTNVKHYIIIYSCNWRVMLHLL